MQKARGGIERNKKYKNQPVREQATIHLSGRGGEEEGKEEKEETEETERGGKKEQRRGEERHAIPRLLFPRRMKRRSPDFYLSCL